MSSPSPLAAFPEPARAAHARWLSERDPSALDAVILAVVAYHRPRKNDAAPTAEPPPDSARLMADLGYDSLALAEVVFFVEDLFKVTISNADLAAIATIADLRAYVRAKVAA